MNVLVINCGSSSLKYQLIDTNTELVLSKGLVEKIGLNGSIFSHTPAGKEKNTITCDINDHKQAINIVMDSLISPEHGVIESLDEIDAVGHRIVHGGEFYSSSVLIDDKVIE